MKTRIEKDSIGDIEVPIDALWGAQTERSRQNFAIGDKMPIEVIKALAQVKQIAAHVNADLNLLSKEYAESIKEAAQEIVDGEHDNQFPLKIYQTGSGTQSNMNVNEVIAKIANKKLRLRNHPIHPNDHVNMSQSSNDVFPVAMHIATKLVIQELSEEIDNLKKTFREKSQQFAGIIKSGRTHLQNAAPTDLGNDFVQFYKQLDFCLEGLNLNDQLGKIPIGGTAVGTGLNAHPLFAEKFAQYLSDLSSGCYCACEEKSYMMASHDSLVGLSASMRTLAMALFKIATDISWLSSDQISELTIPANEPGSSIMPGKVNPTQCEALKMVCVKIFGNDATVAFAGSQGNFQLNVFKPLIVSCVIESAKLLTQAIKSFNQRCVSGIEANHEKIKKHLDKNLMLVTALNKHIGYDNAAKIAKLASKEGITLKEAAVKLKFVTEKDFDKWVVPSKMVYPKI